MKSGIETTFAARRESYVVEEQDMVRTFCMLVRFQGAYIPMIKSKENCNAVFLSCEGLYSRKLECQYSWDRYTFAKVRYYEKR